MTSTPRLTSTDGADISVATGRYDNLTEAVRELVNVMRDGGIGQLEVRQGDLRISLKSSHFMETERPHHAPAPIGGRPEATEDEVEVAEGYVVTSPMIGTFYSSPGPNERAFVEIGDQVEAGQTVAIIEAMKIMNEIVSERSGTVAEVFVKSGEAVEYGHRLMRLT